MRSEESATDAILEWKYDELSSKQELFQKENESLTNEFHRRRPGRFNERLCSDQTSYHACHHFK
jgi:hypothetical protein